jgi:toxin-antitoxin system PIN domain toxin
VLVVDVNVLIYAFQPSSPRHAGWKAWLEGARGRPFTVPDEVALGFVRIVTNRRVFADPATVDEALAFVAALRASPGWRELPRPDARWELLAELCAATGARGADVPDAWLAALARAWGATLVSADRGFAAYPGLAWVDPVGT